MSKPPVEPVVMIVTERGCKNTRFFYSPLFLAIQGIGKYFAPRRKVFGTHKPPPKPNLYKQINIRVSEYRGHFNGIWGLGELYEMPRTARGAVCA